jgi:hypothetical protein
MILTVFTRAALIALAIFSILSPAGVAAAELGVYRWDAPGGPRNVDAFEGWLGKPVQLGEAFEARDTWDNIDGAAWQLGPWSQWVRAKPGRNLVLGVPMMPTAAGVSLDNCAAGQYDAHWQKLANQLAYYGLHWAYLRLGWEMDGSWYAWGAPQGSGREASFAGCFRRIVQTMRAAQPANQWKFVWNPTATWTNASYLTATWPGDPYVDVVGIDLYDQSWVPNTYPYPNPCDSACRLARQQTAWNDHASYLQTMRNFALAHGKLLAIPEWGLYTRPDGHGGGDNPYYIQKMYEFISNPANSVLFHVYFDVKASDGDHHISGLDQPTAFPQAAAKHRQLFGAAIPVVTAPAPAPAADRTPPSAYLTQPAAGTVLRRRTTITMEANASDNVGVAAVEFSIDGRLACRVTASPYRCRASTGSAAQSRYTLTARAVDAAGNAASYSRTYSGAR